MVKHLVLRVRCTCGRNLADVRLDDGNPDWTRDKLLVTPRPNVAQDDYRPWHAANGGGRIGDPARAAMTPGRVEGVDWDWHDRTYTWHCRCGQTHTRRHERLSEVWTKHEYGYDTPYQLVVIGVDL